MTDIDTRTATHVSPRGTLGPGGGFHHVALCTRDWDATIAFYREVLGFEVAMAWPGAAYLRSENGGCVEIFDTSAHPDSGRDSADWREGKYVHLCLQTADVDGVFAKAVEHGATVMSEPWDLDLETTTGQGVVRARLCFFAGPSGETIELIEGLPSLG